MFEPTALYQNAATGELAYGWQLNQYQAGLSGLGRNFLSTAWHKVKKGASNVAHAATHTTLGKIALGVGAAAAGAKLGQFTGLLPKGSLIDLAKLTPGILANQATRLGRGAASVAGTVGHAIFGSGSGGPTPRITAPAATGPTVTSPPSTLTQIAKAAGWTVGTAAKVAAPVAAAVVAPMLTGAAPAQPIGAGTGTPAWVEALNQQAGYQGGLPPSLVSPRIAAPNTQGASPATPRIQIPERSGPFLPTAPRIVEPPVPTAPAPSPSSKSIPLLLAAGAAALALSS